MGINYSVERLLTELATRAPEHISLLRSHRRVVNKGLLTQGLKLHLLDYSVEYPFLPLFDKLGGKKHVLEANMYRHAEQSSCFVLPPMGNVEAAIQLLDAISIYTNVDLFKEPDVMIQVCSPGRLDNYRAALLGIGFYLGSEVLRRYTLEDLATTASYDVSYHRGRRLILYDAGGDFDQEFAWWQTKQSVEHWRSIFANWRKMYRLKREVKNGVAIANCLPFYRGEHRSDIFVTSATPNDLRTINLLATLLVHSQYRDRYHGIWAEKGRNFETDLAHLLRIHELSGLLKQEWVCDDKDGSAFGDRSFFACFQELMSYAFNEAERLSRNDGRDSSQSILYEMRAIIDTYRTAIENSEW